MSIKKCKLRDVLSYGCQKNQIERQIVSEISSRVESNKIPDLLDYKNAIQYTVKNEILINEDKLPSYAEMIDKTHKFEKI